MMGAVLAFVILAAVALIGAVVWLVVVARRGPRGALKGPVCGACGYNLLGLATMTCPECGSDLRAAGILTPRTPRQGARGVAGALLFTVLLGFVAVVASLALLSVLPMRRSYKQQVRLVTPESGAYQEVVLRTGGATWGSAAPALPTEIELVMNAPSATTLPLTPTRLGGSPAAPPALSTAPAARSPRLIVRLDGGYEFASPGAGRIVRPGGFSASAVLDWMKAAGLDTSQRGIAEEAARITGEARLVARNRRWLTNDASSGGYSSSSSGSDSGGQFASRYSSEQADRRQPAWAVILFGLCWIAVWAAGLRHLARRAVPTPGRRHHAG
jgi:hypothetical protein